MQRPTVLREAYEYPFTRLAPGEGVHIDPPSVAIYETLVAKSPTGDALPMLASGSTVSDDGLTWRFDLRAGLRFHTGDACDAAAVVEAYEHLRWNAFHATEVWYWHPVESMSAPSERVVEIRLRHPYARLPSLLWGTHTAVFSERARAADPETDGYARAGGTGPFTLVSWSPSLVVAKRWDDYPGWPGISAGPASVDRIEWQWLPRAADRVAALGEGAVDVIHAPDPAAIDGFRADSRFVVHELPQPSSIYLGLNWERHDLGFDAREMRRAISALIDRERIVRDVLGGHGHATVGAVPPGESFDPSATRRGPERPEAIAFLDGTGWRRGPDGIRARGEARLAFDCVLQDDEVMRGIGGRLAEDLAAAGVELRPSYVPVFEPFYTACQQQPASFVNKWLWQDPIDALIGFTASYCRPSPNWEQAADPALDALYRQWLEAGTPSQLQTVASAIQARLADTMAIIPLVTPTDVWIHSARVTGFEPWPNGLYPYYHRVGLAAD